MDRFALANKRGDYLRWSSGWRRPGGETVFRKRRGSATSRTQERKRSSHVSAQDLQLRTQCSQTYPTGDVVVSQVDLAMQLRKSPDAVAAALSLMLGEQRVQRAALNGYWKLDA